MLPAKTRIDAADTRGNRWLAFGGTASLFLGMILLLGVISLIITGLPTSTEIGIGEVLRQNWLIVLFELNAGLRSGQPDPLHGFNVLDVTILALVGMAFLGLTPVLRRFSKTWMTIAIAMPFLGIAVFLMTGIAGRSAVMGAGLIVSLLMLRSNRFSGVATYTGILSNALVLAGDLGTGVSHSYGMAILLAPGYVLLMTWFFLLGWRLLQLARPAI
jgi:hypothetical protein